MLSQSGQLILYVRENFLRILILEHYITCVGLEMLISIPKPNLMEADKERRETKTWP